MLADAEVEVAPLERFERRRFVLFPFGRSMLPPSLINVDVDGARSADPPTKNGAIAASF